MSIYELGILGNASDEIRQRLIETITSMLEPFALAVGTDVTFRNGHSAIQPLLPPILVATGKMRVRSRKKTTLLKTGMRR